MSKEPMDRFDKLLKAMLAGPPPSARKSGEQPQQAKERKLVEKPGVTWATER